MREIKFRARKRDDSGWEYFRVGYLAIFKDGTCQQYTGLKDKNGKEIYEGDIVKFKTKRTFKPPRVSTRTFKSPVVYEDCAFVISESQQNDSVLWIGKDNQLVVIGNIYENKELLNGKN